MTRKAQGGFLWVRLIFDELEEALDVEDIKLILGQLLGSMQDVYNTIFERIKRRLRKAEYDFLFTAISWVLFSRMPVTSKFLAAVYSLQKPMSAGASLSGLRRLSGSLFARLERTCSPKIIVQSAPTDFETTTLTFNQSTEWIEKEEDQTDLEVNFNELHLVYSSLEDYLRNADDLQCSVSF